MKVFISYAKQDVELAESVAIRLQQAGQSVFFDRSDIPTGSSFDAIIRQQIARADFLIFLASPDSLARGAYALTELTFFKARFRTPDDRVLTVLLRNQPLNELPPYLRSVSIPNIEGDLLAEVTAKTLNCLRRIRTRYYRRVMALFCIGLVLVLAIAGFCLGVAHYNYRQVRFEVADAATGELVRHPLTLTVRNEKTGTDKELRYEPLEEILVQGRSEDFIVKEVTGVIGYKSRTFTEQTKDGRRRIDLFRDDDSKASLFRKMIAPASFVPSITQVEYQKRVIPAESTAVNVEFVCNNQTEHVVDILFYRYYARWDMERLDSARDPWYGPTICPRGTTIIMSKGGSFGANTNGYFYFFGSVGGGEATLLTDGYMFSSLRPTLNVTPDTSDPSRLLKGELVHKKY